MSRRVLGLLTVLLFLAGCGGAQTYPRTTVPVKVDKNRANDPRLGLAKLREVDPCKVLEQLPLERAEGAAGRPKPSFDLRTCELFLKPLPGSDDNRLLKLDIANDFAGIAGAKSTVGGMPAREERQDDICESAIFTDQKNKQGIVVTYISKNKDCQPGYVLAKKILETIRNRPPKWGDAVGSVKPCDLLDPMVRRFLGGHAEVTAGGPADLWHDCPMDGKNGTKLGVSFIETGIENVVDDFGKPKKPMPLGNGVTGTQVMDPEKRDCRVDWNIRKFPDNDSIVSEDHAVVGRVEASQGGEKVDHCKVAVETAKFVVSKVPKQ